MKSGVDIQAPLPAAYYNGQRWQRIEHPENQERIKRLTEFEARATCSVRVFFGEQGWDVQDEFILEGKTCY